MESQTTTKLKSMIRASSGWAATVSALAAFFFYQGATKGPYPWWYFILMCATFLFFLGVFSGYIFPLKTEQNLSSQDDEFLENKIKESETIIHAYGKALEEAGTRKRTNFSPYHPISMLPYPKERIEEAFALAFEYMTDQETIKNFEASLVFLDMFIPDDQVPGHDEKYLKAVEKRKQNNKSTP